VNTSLPFDPCAGLFVDREFETPCLFKYERSVLPSHTVTATLDAGEPLRLSDGIRSQTSLASPAA